MDFRPLIFKNTSVKTRMKYFRVSTRTGNMGRYFAVVEKSWNFKQTGKVRENHTKYWKSQGISDTLFISFNDF